MDLEIRIPWNQFDIPRFISKVIDRGMDIAFQTLFTDTQFYDPETRKVQTRSMTEISTKLSHYGIEISKYTGKHNRHPEHLRDSWTDWNIINDTLILYNSSPAAGYLFNGNSPGGGGGNIVPRESNYLKYYLRSGRGGPRFATSKSVRPVESSGRMAEFRAFVFNTVQSGFDQAMVEYKILEGGVTSDDFTTIIEALNREIERLTGIVGYERVQWKELHEQRRKVPVWSEEWDILTRRAGQKYAEIYEAQKKRSKQVSKLRTVQKTVEEETRKAVEAKYAEQTRKQKRRPIKRR